MIALLAFGMVAFGVVSVSWQLWKAFRTGEVSEDIWFGANKLDDHSGFVIRIAGLLVLLGVLIWFGFQIPELITGLERA